MKKFLILTSLMFFLFNCQNQSSSNNTSIISGTPVSSLKQSSEPKTETVSPVQSPQQSAKTILEQGNIVNPVASFQLMSPDFSNGGIYPKIYTCDGSRSSPPLSWSNAPAGTVSYAITMHHIPSPGAEEHVYMVIYDIPGNINSIESNQKNIGKRGINNVNGKPEYTPPCSQGPGPKLYTITLYALSANTEIIPSDKGVTKATLLNTI